MKEDIVPELLAKIKEDFQNGVDNNKTIESIAKMLKDGQATYKEANDYAIELGDILAKVLGDNITADILPDGRMYYNIAERIMNETLSKNHEMISDVTESVQNTLNEEAGIGIKAIRSELDQDRIDGIVNRLSTEEDFEEVKWLLDEPVKNFSQSIVDDSIKENADFQYKAGLSPKIIRRTSGKCCKWCDALAGTYDYETVKNTGNDVFRRHRFCRCTVEFDPRDGSKRKNVHTKQISGSTEDKEIRMKQYLKSIEEEKEKKKIKKRKLDFFAGVGNKVLAENLGHYIGDNQYHTLLEKAEGEEAKKYIRTAYRKSSIIGDGGTADVRRFEKETGRNLGRNGKTHSKKVDDLINQINNSLRQNLSENDRIFLEKELKKLKEVQD